jgi:hypothetical protein
MTPAIAIVGVLVYLAFTINIFLGIFAVWLGLLLIAIAFGLEAEAERQELSQPYQQLKRW